MLAEWARSHGDRVVEIVHAGQLPLRTELAHPERVGIDRLFDAVAANSRRGPGVPAVIIDAGSAVTVDAVDASGAFLGGAILPGMRLMGEALHDYTALLPRVGVPQLPPDWPGKDTESAVAAGIYWAVAGGGRTLLDRWSASLSVKPRVFLTGGDGPRLASAFPEAEIWPAMTLEGIRLSAEAIA
jgi:type III pantothenate kinase